MEKAGGEPSKRILFRAMASSASEGASLLAEIGVRGVAALAAVRGVHDGTAAPVSPSLRADDVATAALPRAGRPAVGSTDPAVEIHTRPTQVIEIKARKKKVRPPREEEARQGVPQAAQVPAAAKPAEANGHQTEAAPANEPATSAASQQVPPADAPLEEPQAWTDAEIATALRACLTTLAPLGIGLETQPPVKEKACGMAAPIAVKRLGDGVEMRPAPVVNCAMAAALHDWLIHVAQPAAREVLGSPIVRLVGTGGYSCRNRNGAATGPISEHAFGNAVDIGGFVLADGRTVDVQQHWGAVVRKSAPPVAELKESEPPPPSSKKKGLVGGPLASSKSALGGPSAPAASQPQDVIAKPDPAEGKFLRRAHAGACKYFGTVLGPEANAAHHNHLHFDLKARRRKNFCE